MISYGTVPKTSAAAAGGVPPSLRPIPAWRWTAAAVVVFAAAGAGVTLWLLAIAGHAAPGTNQVNARLDAVRTGLAAGAGPAQRPGSCSRSAASTTGRSPPN